MDIYGKIKKGGSFMTFTLKVSENTKQKMIEYYKDKRREKTPPYAIFQAEEADTVITLYESGKAVFQGISADVDAMMWKEMEEHLNPNKKAELSNSKEKKKNESKNKDISKYSSANCIGSDEVGTGDFFGPIVVTATYVKKSDIPFLKDLGVADSKKMTDKKILEIVPQLLKRIPYETILLTNTDYNKYYSSDVNLNKIKAILHNRALLALTKKITSYDYVIMDQFTSPTTYYNYLKGNPFVFRNITFLTKAENIHLSVACASIISRYYFIKHMEKLSQDLEIKLPYGAGEEVDKIGLEIVKKCGFDKLKEYAKLNFKNTEKIKNLLENPTT